MYLIARDRAAIATEMNLSLERLNQLLDNDEELPTDEEYEQVATLINRYCGTRWTVEQLKTLRRRWEYNTGRIEPNETDKQDESESDIKSSSESDPSQNDSDGQNDGDDRNNDDQNNGGNDKPDSNGSPKN